MIDGLTGLVRLASGSFVLLGDGSVIMAGGRGSTSGTTGRTVVEPTPFPTTGRGEGWTDPGAEFWALSVGEFEVEED